MDTVIICKRELILQASLTHTLVRPVLSTALYLPCVQGEEEEQGGDGGGPQTQDGEGTGVWGNHVRTYVHVYMQLLQKHYKFHLLICRVLPKIKLH